MTGNRGQSGALVVKRVGSERVRDLAGCAAMKRLLRNV